MTLDDGVKWSKIVSAILIPVAVVIATLYINSELADRANKQQYVQMATGILTQPSLDKNDSNFETNKELRTWAVDIISAYAPEDIPLPDKVVRAVKAGREIGRWQALQIQQY